MGNIYSEYLVEFDNVNLVVYVSGLNPDGFWEETAVIDDAENPENFAEGYAQSMRDAGLSASVVEITFESDNETSD